MTSTAYGVLAAASFVSTLYLCVAIRAIAVRRKLVDLPNERSLHQVPVPRLGGVAIVLSVWATLACAYVFASVRAVEDMLTWFIGSIAIAALGFMDDVRSVPAGVRFAVQIAVSACVLVLTLHGTTIALLTGVRVSATPVVIGAGVVFVVATTNIYNFMDGMDGITGAQTFCAGIAYAVAAAAVGSSDLALVALVVATASAGFLVHNAPPATMFLGDAGSTMLGFTFSTFALIGAARPVPVPFGVLPIALAPFLLDGTFTILRRLSRGEVIWRAHRSHLYQRAVATGLTHRQVLVIYVAWSSAAGAAALFVATGRTRDTAGAALAMLTALAAVWFWVVRLERNAIRVSQQSVAP